MATNATLQDRPTTRHPVDEVLPAPKLAVYGLADQSVLGLNRLADKEHEELGTLAREYRNRFGFPLIMAVRDQESFDQVLRHGWERLNNSPTQEHAAALIEIAKVAAHRFDRLVADANPIHSARLPHLDA